MSEFPPISSNPIAAPTSPIHEKHSHKLIIVAAILGVLVLVLGAFSVWAYVNYTSQKTNVDSKIAAQVADAVKTQKEKDAVNYQTLEKTPNREFSGPEDYGSVTFSYPKTWSIYVNKDASAGGNYEAYFNPFSVPTISNSQQFALRVYIQESDYDKVVASYSSQVKNGDLHSSSITVNGIKGTRLDGNFSKDIRGSEVIFKIRDKTLLVRTDAATFQSDFDALAQTIKFIQ